MDFTKIKAVTFDVDGVMTDGSLLQMDNGDLLRIFNAKDTFAVRYAVTNGLPVGVFTGGSTPGVLDRFRTCMVPDEDIHLGCRGKLPLIIGFCEKYGISLDEVLYIGDDIPDLPAIRAVGIGVAPADAATEVRGAAAYVSPFPGGHGCVRDCIEQVMKAQGKWAFDGNYDYSKVY